jgi:hypothetical protein
MRLLSTRILVSAVVIAIPLFLIAVLWKPASAGSAFGGPRETLSLGTVLIKRSTLILIDDAKGYFADEGFMAPIPARFGLDNIFHHSKRQNSE